ncbi:4204_t:CDS:2, partial [Entrophospora sp. SA101]
HKEIEDKKDTEFTQQLQEVETYNQNLPQEVRYPKYEIHPQAIYTSRLINTQQITQLLKCEGSGVYLEDDKLKQIMFKGFMGPDSLVSEFDKDTIIQTTG